MSDNEDRDPRRDAGLGLPPAAGPRPLGGLGDLADLLGGETTGSRRFLTGLITGAVVGAVLAGGQLIRRRRSGRRRAG